MDHKDGVLQRIDNVKRDGKKGMVPYLDTNDSDLQEGRDVVVVLVNVSICKVLQVRIYLLDGVYVNVFTVNDFRDFRIFQDVRRKLHHSEATGDLVIFIDTLDKVTAQGIANAREMVLVSIVTTNSPAIKEIEDKGVVEVGTRTIRTVVLV